MPDPHSSLVPWRTFVEVCRTTSLSAAATVLGYTQSAVSRQIAGLERDMGAPLLERGARGVRLTEAGAALLPHARLVVAEAERGRRAVTSARAGGRHLALGAVPSAALGFVPSVLRRLVDPPPWTMLTGLTPRLVAHVAAGELDLAVITDSPPGLPSAPGVLTRHLFDDVMGVVLPADHRLAHRRRVSIALLADEMWIEDNPGSEALLHDLAARHQIAVRVDRAGSDLMTKIALVAAGHGVALAPRTLTPALRADVRFVALTAAPRRGVHVATRVDRADLEPLVTALAHP
jgi:DNA-binding transcriptional LysR family regulator